MSNVPFVGILNEERYALDKEYKKTVDNHIKNSDSVFIIVPDNYFIINYCRNNTYYELFLGNGNSSVIKTIPSKDGIVKVFIP
jgi:hypothetical protein